MNARQSADPESKLPDVPLSELSEGTKDFLIAHSLTGKPVTDVIRDVLSQAAAAAGFPTEGRAA